MKRGSITVSKSKRGTTIKASGAAAQELFDAMTATPKPPPAGTVYTTVAFEDRGQDFLEWDVEESTGRVFDCRPAQAWAWIGRIVDLATATPGTTLDFLDCNRFVKHPVKAVRTGRVL